MALVLLLGGGITLQVRTILRTTLSHELQNRGISITRDVAARSVDLLLVHDLYAVHQLLRDTLANNEDVRYAFIVSPQGDTLPHTFEGGFPRALATLHTVPATERYHLQRVSTDEGVIWDFAVPVFEGRTGIARLGLSEQSMQATLANVNGQPLDGVVVGDSWNNVKVTSGNKGPGRTEIDLWTNTMEITVKRDAASGQPYTSEVSFPFSSFLTTIPDEQMIQAGYCANELECQWKRANESYYCGGHYSWEVIFQKTH